MEEHGELVCATGRGDRNGEPGQAPDLVVALAIITPILSETFAEAALGDSGTSATAVMGAADRGIRMYTAQVVMAARTYTTRNTMNAEVAAPELR